MKRPAPLMVPFVAALGVFTAGRARAEAAPPVAWWIDAAPWSCARFIGPVARAVQTACDAAGGECALAATAASASRRLTLFCEEDESSWRVSGEAADHTLLFSASFDGGADDRPARIGQFVAHQAESLPATDARPPRFPRGSATPARSPAAPAEGAPPPPLAFSPQEVPPTEDEKERDPDAPPRPHEGGLSVDASLGSDGNMVTGVHAVAAFALGDAKVGVAVAYAKQDASARFVRAGFVTALGAPWDLHVVGCSLEVGASVGQTLDQTFPVLHYGAWGASPYAQWTMVIEIPVQPFRPWVGTSALFVLDQFGSANQTLSLVGGIAWSAW
jgi:hypothetical protein